MKATRSLLIASVWLGMTSTMSCDLLPPCNKVPDYISATEASDLWVGDKVKITARAWSSAEVCQPSFASSDKDPNAYIFTVKDTTVATLSSAYELTAIAPGVTSFTVRHKRGGTEGTANIRVGRPVSAIRIVVTPAAPVVSDTVDVVTQAIDANGEVTDAVFSGLNLVPPALTADVSGPIRLTYGSDRGRWILRAPASYRFINSVMHLGVEAVSAEITVKVP